MSGPITNTRTMEGSLVEAIKRLERFEQTAHTQAMIAKAKRYLAIVAEWSVQPPDPDEEYTVIPEVLLLLKQCMTYSANAAADLGGDISLEPGPDPRATLPGHGSAIGRLPVERKIPAPWVPGEVGMAQPRLEPGVGLELLRPDRVHWQPVAGLAGVAIKTLREPSEDGWCRALLRLAPGAVLPARRYRQAQDLYVLSGMLQFGEHRIQAGELIRTGPGATVGPLRCLAECTVLLIGSGNGDLLGEATTRPTES